MQLYKISPYTLLNYSRNIISSHLFIYKGRLPINKTGEIIDLYSECYTDFNIYQSNKLLITATDCPILYWKV